MQHYCPKESVNNKINIFNILFYVTFCQNQIATEEVLFLFLHSVLDIYDILKVCAKLAQYIHFKILRMKISS